MTSEAPVALTTPPAGYSDWLAALKLRIHAAQQRAALAVNRELLALYWQIGRDILARQSEQGWGAKVIDRLAHDLPQQIYWWPDRTLVSGSLEDAKQLISQNVPDYKIV